MTRISTVVNIVRPGYQQDIIVEKKIKCDGCGAIQLLKANGKGKQKRALKEMGWKLEDFGEYCPGCV